MAKWLVHERGGEGEVEVQKERENVVVYTEENVAQITVECLIRTTKTQRCTERMVRAQRKLDREWNGRVVGVLTKRCNKRQVYNNENTNT